MMELDASAERLVLRYTAVTRTSVLWSVAVVMVVPFGMFTLLLALPWDDDASEVALGVMHTGSLALVGLAIILGVDHTAAVTTTFDQERRSIRVETLRRRGGLEVIEWVYDDVQELRLASAGCEDADEECLTLVAKAGPQLTLVCTRHNAPGSSWVAKVAERIKAETGLPGPGVDSDFRTGAGWMRGAHRI